MITHHGHVVEKVIRRDGHSISDISRLLSVNRRSIYNWFDQPKLRPEIIYRIGCVIEHDFSIELPDVFSPNDFKFNAEVKEDVIATGNDKPLKDDAYWKEKYYSLLERYDLLKKGQMIVAI